MIDMTNNNSSNHSLPGLSSDNVIPLVLGYTHKQKNKK